MIKQILLLAAAGALGALCRYGLWHLVQKFTGSEFPYGTLVVNVLGCLIIGYIIQIALNPNVISPDLRTIITVGFLGAFTTFSAFSNETVTLLTNGAFGQAAINVFLNVGLGLMATFAGIVLGKMTIGNV